MTTDQALTIAAAALAFAASVIAMGVSLYTARFRRFASERWWERKAEAYTRVVDSLTKCFMSAKGLHLLVESSLPKDSIPRLFDELVKQLSNLREDVTRGAFILSSVTISEVQAFLDQARPTREDLDATVVSVLPRTIEAVRSEAKRDLCVE